MEVKIATKASDTGDEKQLQGSNEKLASLLEEKPKMAEVERNGKTFKKVQVVTLLQGSEQIAQGWTSISIQ